MRMKLTTAILFIILFTIKLSFAGNEVPIPKDTSSYPTQNTFNHQFFDKWYLHYNVEQFIDNYYSFSIQQLETTGDYSQPNNYTFSILGESYKWNKYYYDDFRMNDMFFPGASLHKPYLFNVDMDFDIEKASLNFIPAFDNKKSVYLQYNNGNMGDRINDADDIINALAGHGSPYQRLLYPINYRRRVQGNGLFYFHNILKTEKGDLYQNIYLNIGERMLTNLTYKGIANYYPENYLQFNINGNLPVLFKKLFDQNSYLISYNERDQMFNEYAYSMNETAKLKELNLSLYGKKKNEYTTGFNFSYKNIQHNVPDFSRNIMDVDGMSFDPWYVDGNVLELAFSHKQKKKLDDHFSFDVNLYDGLMYFNPLQQNSFNTTYSQTSDTNYQSLYYTQWQSTAFWSALLDNSGGISYYHTSDNKKVNFKAYIGATLDGFMVTSKSFVKPSYEASIDLNIHLFPMLDVAFNIGKKQLPFDAEYIKFFSNNYMSGQTYSWHDLNNDKQFQANEKGVLFTTTGGQYHEMSSRLRQPYEVYFDTHFDIKIDKRNVFIISGQYRQFFDLWLMEYTKPASQLGYYKSVDINIYDMYPAQYDQIYFLNNGQVNYKAMNDYPRYLKAGGGNFDWLTKNPFYAGFTLDYQYRGEKLFIDASFTTFKVIGFAAMGNGVLANSPGVLSESMANPNSYLNRLGRFDTDRSYIGRLLISYIISKRLTMAFQFKYKDGEPMSIFNTNTDITSSGGDYTKQVAIWNSNFKGDNLFTGVSGNRTDCFYNFELRTKYTFFINKKPLDLNFTVYNILDLGFQSSELTFPPFIHNGNRYADDIQIPRGFMLSASYKF